MGCKISSDSSSKTQQQEDSSCSENSTLLQNGLSNGSTSGYGIERLTDDSPSPERRPGALQTNYESSGTSSQHAAAHPVQTDVSPRENKTRLIRSEDERDSETGSRAGRVSVSKHVHPPEHVASRQVNGQLDGYSDHQQRSNNPLAGLSNPRGLVRTKEHQMNKQNAMKEALKLGGPVETDGIIHVPQSSPAGMHTHSSAKTQRGKEIMEELSKAYHWREQFEHPSPEFLALMDRLYMECQLHLTALSSRGDLESRREADMIVNEMVALRNYWGPQLLPSSTCNAFVRERIPLILGVDQRQFRIDCAQFFEPVPFYGNQQSSCPGELMKLYRFSVYNVAKNEVILRYYLERSNVIQLYHVLCFTCENYRGQVKPYGTEPPTYWEVRQNMLEDVYSRLLSGLSPTKQYQPPKVPVYPANIMVRPAHLQVMPVTSNT